MEQVDSTATETEGPLFVSLGMVVMDEIRFSNSETMHNVPGGSGIYSTLGARLFAAGTRSVDVGCVVIAGCDFPQPVLELIRGWKTDLLVKTVTDKSTRGLLEYQDIAFGRKTFVYLTTPLRPCPNDLESSNLLRAVAFHILASPEDLEKQVSSLLALREGHGIARRPVIVWEPAPVTCEKAQVESHLQACKLVDFFSPNHLELTYLIAGKDGHEPPFAKDVIESYGSRFLDSGIGPDGKGAAVIRCGEHGSLTLSASGADWLPPFYDTPSSPKVVDPTGAGNAFLGGFSVGYQETGDLREASMYGCVAASFALEQFGLPQFSPSSLSAHETWNGAVAFNRVQEFKQKLVRF